MAEEEEPAESPEEVLSQEDKKAKKVHFALAEKTDICTEGRKGFLLSNQSVWKQETCDGEIWHMGHVDGDLTHIYVWQSTSMKHE